MGKTKISNEEKIRIVVAFGGWGLAGKQYEGVFWNEGQSFGSQKCILFLKSIECYSYDLHFIM